MSASKSLATLEDGGRKLRPRQGLAVEAGSRSRGRIFLFPDRIAVANPGRLPNTLVPEDLYAGCQPVRRNQMLAGFLRDFTSPLTQRAYMEARGEGFLTLLRECRQIGARRPDLSMVGDSVRLEIYAARPVTSSA